MKKIYIYKPKILTLLKEMFKGGIDLEIYIYVYVISCSEYRKKNIYEQGNTDIRLCIFF